MTKKITSVVLALLMVSALLVGCAKKTTFTIEVKQDGAVTLSKSYSVTEETSVEAVLVKYAEELGATLVDSDYGKYVAGMNGYEADSSKNEFFEFLVDGVSSEVGVASVNVEEGKVYTFNLTTW